MCVKKTWGGTGQYLGWVEHRLLMRQCAFLVVRPQSSRSNPNFSKPRTRTANSDFWSRLTHQLLERLKFTISNLQIYLPKRRILRSWRWGLTIHSRIVFLSWRMNKCLERVNGRHFWNPGVFSYAIIPRCRPNSRVFFFIVTSIVYGIEGYTTWRRFVGINVLTPVTVSQ